MSDVIKTAHDVLDAAKVFAADGTHPQLVERIKLLVAERDQAVAQLKLLLSGMDKITQHPDGSLTLSRTCPDAGEGSMDGPSKRWRDEMSEIDDSKVSVGGLMSDDNAEFDDMCDVCGSGFYLPSGVCDHCNLPKPRSDGRET